MSLKQRKNKKLHLGKNLDYLLNLHDLDIKNLSIEIGVPPATIARMRKKDCNPTVSTIEPFLNFFRVDMDTFLYEDMSTQEYQNKKTIGNLSYIPVIELADIKNEPKKSKIVKFIGAAGVNGKNIFGINIATASLAPAFQNNSIIIIDPDLKPKEGDYVLCLLGDDVKPMFRQIFIDGSNYFFKPINPGFGEMKFYEKFKILGVIIKSIGTFR